MENVKKQLRFFKILVGVLLVVVVAQCSFWLNQFAGSTRAGYNPVQKVKMLQQQPRVVAPAIISFLNLIGK